MSLPNFLIVGASKSGTSSIWHYLNEHPDIVLPKPKEPLFFIYNIWKKNNASDPAHKAVRNQLVDSIEAYEEMFKDCNKKAIGEASASYLYHHEEAILSINKYLSKDVKIIIVLRNPVDKVISHFKFYKTTGWEPYSFKKALKLEKSRIRDNYNAFYHYTNQGFYHKAVSDYLDNFEDVHICFYDDLKSDPASFIVDIHKFLNVEPRLPLETEKKYNVSRPSKSTLFDKLLKKQYFFKSFLVDNLSFINWRKLRQVLVKINTSKSLTPGIMDEDIEMLKKLYISDVKLLQKRLNIELIDKWDF